MTQLEFVRTLATGSYFKVTTRTGVAHTTINDDGTIFYMNRRGEVSSIEAAEFCKLWNLGYTTLNARSAQAVLNSS